MEATCWLKLTGGMPPVPLALTRALRKYHMYIVLKYVICFQGEMEWIDPFDFTDEELGIPPEEE